MRRRISCAVSPEGPLAGIGSSLKNGSLKVCVCVSGWQDGGL
jgi:hypothetical protein